jgi:transcriptional regulator with XRE-family HTH domain
MDNLFDNGKIAVALRAARAAAGWNQQEFADRMSVAKSTVARIETLEMAAKGDFLIKAMRLFREAGVEVDLHSQGGLSIQVSDLTVAAAVDALQDETKRRTDRKSSSADTLLKKQPW